MLRIFGSIASFLGSFAQSSLSSLVNKKQGWEGFLLALCGALWKLFCQGWFKQSVALKLALVAIAKFDNQPSSSVRSKYQ